MHGRRAAGSEVRRRARALPYAGMGPRTHDGPPRGWDGPSRRHARVAGLRLHVRRRCEAGSAQRRSRRAQRRTSVIGCVPNEYQPVIDRPSALSSAVYDTFASAPSPVGNCTVMVRPLMPLPLTRLTVL